MSDETFGRPVVTSEGEAIDYSVVGVVRGIDTTELVGRYEGEGGSERTLVFWEVENHSGEELVLYHKGIEHVGADGIAYNSKENRLNGEAFEPGWRTGNFVEIIEGTRIRYVSCVEMPVRLDALKASGYDGVHGIEVTDEMRYTGSAAPLRADFE
jgi:hypothetical protein